MSTAAYACRLLGGGGIRYSVHRTIAVALVIMMASVVACATQSGRTSGQNTPNATASQTAGAAATRAAEPVLVDVTAQQEGALATHAAQLVVAVTVANHTPASIHIYRPCEAPFFDLELEVNHVSVTGNLDLEDPCLLGNPPGDKEPAIAAGGAHTFTVTVDLKLWTALSPGPYALLAKVQWHQGSQDALDQLSAGQSDIPHGVAEGTGAITLQ